MGKPIFYSGTKNASSWAMRAWLALKAAGYEFDELVVDIRWPQRFNNLASIRRFSPPGCVPVLDTGRGVIADSNAIMEFANDFSGGKLLPKDIEARARARSLVAWQHSGLSSICERISFESAFYPEKRPLTDEEQAECGRLFGVLEDCLAKSGGPYLFGTISLADFMLTPAAFRLSRHKADTTCFPATSDWIAELSANRLITEWMDEADQLPHIWFDDYLVPGMPVTLTSQRPTASIATRR
ncbi:MAG: glutathione S-transferase family protein [Pseudomonadota bacterium]